MTRIVDAVLEVEQVLREMEQKAGYPSERGRARTLLTLARSGLSQRATARLLGRARSYVAETIRRFRDGGLDGLAERRVGRAVLPRHAEILGLLPTLVSGQPPDFGWNRSTWSVELVALEVMRQLDVRVSRTHIGRLLRKSGCRRVRPKPTVAKAPANRAEQIRALNAELDALPAGDVVLYSDEVDIHLNPKVGPDWSPAGVRKDVVTPGQNRKHYLAGAYYPPTDTLVVVDGERKRSALFIALLEELARRFAARGTVHLVVDNYIIHKSKITQRALAKLDGKVVLHFLPPYCPDDNPIERVWWDLHAHVTRNHRHPDMAALLDAVLTYVNDYDGNGAGIASTARKAA